MLSFLPFHHLKIWEVTEAVALEETEFPYAGDKTRGGEGHELALKWLWGNLCCKWDGVELKKQIFIEIS